eukprot:2820746-Alexandrium_andersonii.AAC.1
MPLRWSSLSTIRICRRLFFIWPLGWSRLSASATAREGRGVQETAACAYTPMAGAAHAPLAFCKRCRPKCQIGFRNHEVGTVRSARFCRSEGAGEDIGQGAAATHGRTGAST